MLDEDLNTRALEKNALLWHYTNFTGLKGVLAGTLWASSLPYLNDTEEFRYGAHIALEVAWNQFATRLRDGEHGYGSAVHSGMVSFFGYEYAPRDVFVASLSTERDDLSQWRAYGGAGPIFSIGFDPQKLERRADETLFMLDEVKYEKRDIVADLTLALTVPLNELPGSHSAVQGSKVCRGEGMAVDSATFPRGSRAGTRRRIPAVGIADCSLPRNATAFTR